jgi:hypothetical protein
MTAQASTIVQLGAQGGTTDMLTATDTGPKLTGNYDATRIFTPPAVDSGYAGQQFAATTTKGQNNNWTNNATFDYVQVIGNMGTAADAATRFYEAMLVWDGGANASGQSAFLGSPSDTELTSFHVEFKNRGTANDPTVSFLLETTAGWYISNGVTHSDTLVDDLVTGYTIFDAIPASLTWIGFSKFGVTDGTITEAADLADFVSVGFYLSDTNDATNGFTGGFVRNFEVTAVPEPATYDLLGGLLVLGSVMVRRRR